MPAAKAEESNFHPQLALLRRKTEKWVFTELESIMTRHSLRKDHGIQINRACFKGKKHLINLNSEKQNTFLASGHLYHPRCFLEISIKSTATNVTHRFRATGQQVAYQSTSAW